MDYKEMKPNNFKAFKNKNKRSDDDADFTGSIKLADGVEYWFNVRQLMSAKGDPYLKGWIGKPKQALRLKQSVAEHLLEMNHKQIILRRRLI